MKTILRIDGMSCQNCVKHVTEALQQIDGVTEVSVDMPSKTATVMTDTEISMDIFASAIDDAGYDLVQ